MGPFGKGALATRPRASMDGALELSATTPGGSRILLLRHVLEFREFRGEDEPHTPIGAVRSRSIDAKSLDGRSAARGSSPGNRARREEGPGRQWDQKEQPVPLEREHHAQGAWPTQDRSDPVANREPQREAPERPAQPDEP